jgi:hypothetical protein
VGKDVLQDPSFAVLNIAISLLETGYVVAVQVDTWMFAGVVCSSTAFSMSQNCGIIASVMGGMLFPRMSSFTRLSNLALAAPMAQSARFWTWSAAIVSDGVFFLVERKSSACCLRLAARVNGSLAR